ADGRAFVRFNRVQLRAFVAQWPPTPILATPKATWVETEEITEFVDFDRVWVLLANDRSDIAAKLSNALRRAGYRSIVITPSAQFSTSSADTYGFDLGEAEQRQAFWSHAFPESPPLDLGIVDLGSAAQTQEEVHTLPSAGAYQEVCGRHHPAIVVRVS